MAVWMIWVAIAILALVGEALTLGLFLASVAIAAFVAALISLVVSPVWTIVVFAVLALLLLFFVRPVALRFLPGGEKSTAPHVGPSVQQGIAVELVDHRQGEIRVGSGEFWSARALEPGMTIRPGAEVEIVHMDGLTARVRPVLESASEGSPADSNFGLSSREIEVLRLVSQGMSNQEIADELILSPRTVHHHVSHIFNKMGVNSRVDAVRLAMEQGLVPMEKRGQ